MPDGVVVMFSQLNIAISSCKLINFEPTNARELLGLAQKIASKSCLDPLPSELLSHCLDDLLPTIVVRITNLSFTWSLQLCRLP